MHTLLDHLAVAVMLVMSSVAAFTDLRTGLIPNSVVACGAAAGVLAQLATAAFGQAALTAVLQRMGFGLLLGSLLPLVLYGFGALGGGDVKLFAAIGLCVGPVAVLGIELWAHVLALCIVPFQLLRAGSLRSTLCGSGLLVWNACVPARLRRPVDRARFTALRFAPAIWAAAVWVCVMGERLP